MKPLDLTTNLWETQVTEAHLIGHYGNGQQNVHFGQRCGENDMFCLSNQVCGAWGVWGLGLIDLGEDVVVCVSTNCGMELDSIKEKQKY